MNRTYTYGVVGLTAAALLAFAGMAPGQGPGRGPGPGGFGQDKKEFFKKMFEGRPGVPAAEPGRGPGDFKSLQGQIDKLQQEIAETNRKLDRLLASTSRGSEPERAKNPPLARGPEAKSDKGGKGPPPWAGTGKGPPWAGDRGPWASGKGEKFTPPAFARGGFGGPPWMRGGSDGRGYGSYDSRGRSPGDLENRVNRLERAVDELRREIRSRRY